jgi:transcriptional regulator with XRE-family HTH domain
MGRAPREKPLRLAEKLKQIREHRGLSQGGMVIRLGYDESKITRGRISSYELGEKEPSLIVLYAYAKVANVIVDVLIDDELDLPVLIPSNEKSPGRKRRGTNQHE